MYVAATETELWAYPITPLEDVAKVDYTPQYKWRTTEILLKISNNADRNLRDHPMRAGKKL